MGKKLLLYVCCLFVLNTSIYSQSVSDLPDENPVVTITEPLRQYQTFSWKPVVNARGYCLSIQQKNGVESSDSSNEDYTDIEIVNLEQEKNRYETLLYPGEYRVKIEAVNLFGKKSQASWIPFIILNETEPFLLDSTFEFQKQNNSLFYTVEPVKNFNEEIPNSTLVEIIVKGRNIFFPETEFYFTPIENTNKDGESFERYSSLRTKIPCEVIARDRETNSVTVNVDSALFETGYYELTVVNPGNNKTSLEVFVESDRLPELIEDGLAYDRHYAIRLLDFDEDLEDSAFTSIIVGASFTPDAKIVFEPIYDVGYPFETLKNREGFTANLVSNLGSLAKNPNAIEMKIQVTEGEPFSGCYKMYATNNKGTSNELKVRLNVNYQEQTETMVKKITSSLNSKTQDVNFSLEGIDLSPDYSYCAVSHLLKDGTNVKIPLEVLDNSRDNSKITLQVNSVEFPEKGMYAIQIETDTNSVVAYCDISGTFKSKIKILTDSDLENLFLRQVDYTYDESGEKWINDFPMKMEQTHVIVEDVHYGNQWGWNNLYSFGTKISSDLKKVDGKMQWVRYNNVEYLDHIIVTPKINIVDGKYQEPVEIDAIQVHSVQGESNSKAEARIEITDDNKLFAKGDTLLIKTDVELTTSAWDIYLITDYGLEFQYKPKRKNPKLKKGQNILEIPYSELEAENNLFCTNYEDFGYHHKNEMVFPTSNEWEKILFVRKDGMSVSTLTIQELKIYDSVRSDKFRPETFIKPIVFTDLGFTFGGPSFMFSSWGKQGVSSSPIAIGIDLSLIRFTSWLTFDVSTRFDNPFNATDFWCSLRLELPNDYFSPYVGAGFGLQMSDKNKNTNQIVPVSVGVVLFDFLDLRYECNAIKNKYGIVLYDSYSVGLRFRLRKRRIVKEPLI